MIHLNTPKVSDSNKLGGFVVNSTRNSLPPDSLPPDRFITPEDQKLNKEILEKSQAELMEKIKKTSDQGSTTSNDVFVPETTNTNRTSTTLAKNIVSYIDSSSVDLDVPYDSIFSKAEQINLVTNPNKDRPSQKISTAWNTLPKEGADLDLIKHLNAAINKHSISALNKVFEDFTIKPSGSNFNNKVTPSTIFTGDNTKDPILNQLREIMEKNDFSATRTETGILSFEKKVTN